MIVAASLVAGALAVWIGSAVRRRGLVPLGIGLAAIALVLVRVTNPGEITLLVAVVGGIGLGTALPWPWATTSGRRHTWLVAGSGCVLAVGLVLWVGATDPTVQWFGTVHSHGPRDGDAVALTFDDGPDAAWTPAVRDILAAYDAKATFFAVGRTVEAQPAVVRDLVEDGHLVANHSYSHDSWTWLNPGYPELRRAQDVFRDEVGVCPALFRPPRGQRTPFMLRQVGDAGMHTVTWDVSAEDWSDDDGVRVARRILDQVRPGSVILLHDGLDGTVRADRSVLRVALPRILDGLAARGLRPVRLDDLLGLRGYLDDC